MPSDHKTEQTYPITPGVHRALQLFNTITAIGIYSVIMGVLFIVTGLIPGNRSFLPTALFSPISMRSKNVERLVWSGVHYG